MSDLLPYNSTEQERALAETIARISDVPVVVREVWNPDTCPSSVLPWLAWAFSVDDWDTTWSDEQKRKVIKESVYSQRIKGTIGAVTRQLVALGYQIQILEWFKQSPIGQPYTFDVYITANQYPLTQEDFKKILQVIDTNKNLRSHLDETQLIVKSESKTTAAIVCGTGNEISLTNYTRFVGALNDYVMVQPNISIGA
ncbi:tail protein [Escherichia phage vB_EcoM-ep3]|uniref:Tail protein n=2 Tax=Jilinvirus TaxID=1918725 RepID=A0A088FVH1_9CAUD|nr:tail protein [Escherichia phage vB_EcoM-ep3]YP_009600716.1 tail protein [Escherichia phage vB_EcoM_ECOO78]AIM50566.1 tail protein [Escherichia phage vB_EcoM-ep3]ARM70448.1 tail protein [Escherichia phage vB_EcoM_ECOO78]